MNYSALLVEGAHEQTFLCALLSTAFGWRREAEAPQGVIPSRAEEGSFVYVSRGGICLVIANMNGVPKLLGVQSTALVQATLSATAIAVMIDADDQGIEARSLQVQSHFGPSISAASRATHGSVVRGGNGERSFGLWVASRPDGMGTLDDTIRIAAEIRHPALVPIADRFVSELTDEARHDWRGVRQKAVLGSLGQLWRAGGSLASALQERDQWVHESMATVTPFAELGAFINAMVGG